MIDDGEEADISARFSDFFCDGFTICEVWTEHPADINGWDRCVRGGHITLDGDVSAVGESYGLGLCFF